MEIKLPARDGVMLAATLFEPLRSNGSALLLNSGTGIPRQFYGAFARHLAERGFAVLTYDYRGIGESEAPRSATMEEWGAVDQASMIDHLVRLRPGDAVGLVGHSLGGQVLGGIPRFFSNLFYGPTNIAPLFTPEVRHPVVGRPPGGPGSVTAADLRAEHTVHLIVVGHGRDDI